MDSDQKAWCRTETGGAIVPARHGHSAVIYQNSMWIFGGVDNEGNELSDVYEFDFDRFTWQCVSTSKSPSGRWGHSCLVYGDSMFIFGGRDKLKNYNDIYEFHFNSRSWSLVSVYGIKPPPRHYHRAILYGDHMHVLGGYQDDTILGDFYYFNFERKMWGLHGSHSIPPRYGHSMVVYNNVCFIFGGVVQKTEVIDNSTVVYIYYFGIFYVPQVLKF